MKACVTCQVQIPKGRSKYCSDECAREGRKKSVLTKCVICPREIYNISGRKYCSDECARVGLNRRRQQQKAYGAKHGYSFKVCPWCNDRFLAYRKDKVYCTPKCTRRAWRSKCNGSISRERGECKYCGRVTQYKRFISCAKCATGKKRTKVGKLLV